MIQRTPWLLDHERWLNGGEMPMHEVLPVLSVDSIVGGNIMSTRLWGANIKGSSSIRCLKRSWVARWPGRLDPDSYWKRRHHSGRVPLASTTGDMPLIYVVIACILATVIACLLSGCGRILGNTDNESFSAEYTNMTHGFSIKWDPVRFRLIDIHPSSHFDLDIQLWSRDVSNDYFIGFSDEFVEIQAITSSDASEYFKEDLDALRRYGRVMREGSVAGLKGYVGDVVVGGSHAKDFLLLHAGSYYRLTATCEAEEWARSSPELIAIVESFRLARYR